MSEIEQKCLDLAQPNLSNFGVLLVDYRLVLESMTLTRGYSVGYLLHVKLASGRLLRS